MNFFTGEVPSLFELYSMKNTLYLIIFNVYLLLSLSASSQPAAGFEKGIRQDSVPEIKLLNPLLVNKFYSINNNNLFWLQQDEKGRQLREQLLQRLDSAYYFGLVQKKYHAADLSAYIDTVLTDSANLQNADRLFTDAAIALMKDIYQGYNLQPRPGYDQLSAKFADADNDYLLQGLINTSGAEQFGSWIDSLEPSQFAYTALKNEFRRQKEKQSMDTAAILLNSMNYYRWIHHFRFGQLIVINLPAAWLQYYENDSLLFQMKAVVGKPSTPTPRFATVCDQVILYPYWYVPGSILFKEYLPKIKNNPGWLDAHNMQVVDGAGKVLNHYELDWASYHAGNFPYMVRQSTGCDNALGVIKFNIVTPYGVYLHDTNNKTAFLSASRFFSHGCMRIEEPLELGNRLLAGSLDTRFLQSCFKEQIPKFIKLEKPVPVFAVYMRAVADSTGKIRYYKDVYKLK